MIGSTNNLVITTCYGQQQRIPTKSVSHLQVFYHTSLGAPVVSTLLCTINNNWLSTFPRLTADSVRWYLTKTIQTIMGYMHKVRHNIRSMKKVRIDDI